MILPANFYLGRPVLSLQTMLREISFQHGKIPRVIPDGVFGEHTLEAVMIFQREFKPPVTGQVDNDTWNAISAVYQSMFPRAVSPGLGDHCRDYTISPGERSVHLYLIQSMFKALTRVLEEIEDCEVTGIHAGASVRNTCTLQRMGGTPETGVIDKDTWDILSRLYTIFVSYVQTPWLSRPETLAD